MDAAVGDLLICPLCHGPFDWTGVLRTGTEIREATLRCPGCGTRAGIHEGIGDFPPGDTSAERAAPPVEDEVRPAAPPTPKGWPATAGRPSDWILERLPSGAGRVLELGPGAGEISRTLARRKVRPMVTDLHPGALARLRDGWPAEGGFDGLAFDPHSIPLADRSIGPVASLLGLQNLPGPLVTLRELRRVANGPFVGAAAFLSEPGGPNHRLLVEEGVGELFFEESCLELFRKAHWSARFEPRLELRVEPGGPSEASAFPHQPAMMRWGLLHAT